MIHRSRHPTDRVGQRGVTLVELLLALMILGIASSVVALNLPPGDQNSKREAQRFAARLKAASDEAITSSEPLGLDYNASAYGFVRYRDGGWVVIDDRIFARWSLDQGIDLAITIGETSSLRANDEIISGGGSIAPSLRSEGELALRPQVQLRPIGEDTPMVAIFTGPRHAWAVTLERNGKVSLARHDTP